MPNTHLDEYTQMMLSHSQPPPDETPLGPPDPPPMLPMPEERGPSELSLASPTHEPQGLQQQFIPPYSGFEGDRDQAALPPPQPPNLDEWAQMLASSQAMQRNEPPELGGRATNGVTVSYRPWSQQEEQAAWRAEVARQRAAAGLPPSK